MHTNRLQFGFSRKALDEFAETRISPLSGGTRQPVLHWVVMDVIRMPDEIGFVAQQVLPVARLLEPAFIPSQCGFAMLGEPRLDQPPACGKVGVVLG